MNKTKIITLLALLSVARPALTYEVKDSVETKMTVQVSTSDFFCKPGPFRTVTFGLKLKEAIGNFPSNQLAMDNDMDSFPDTPNCLKNLELIKLRAVNGLLNLEIKYTQRTVIRQISSFENKSHCQIGAQDILHAQIEESVLKARVLHSLQDIPECPFEE